MPRVPNDILIPATVGIGAFAAFMPHLSELRRCDGSFNRELVADVRMAESAGIGVTIAVGALVAILMREWYPMWIAVLTCAGMIALFEYTLNANRPFSKE